MSDKELLNIKKLAEKLASVSAEMGAVEKDGKNTFSNYGFISGEKMETIMRTALPKHDLSIIPSVKSYEESSFTNDKGKVTIRSLVFMDFKIIDTEMGYSEIHPFFGSDQDTGGKSGGQAITECCKRFYFKLFHVTASDDIDPDSKTEEVQKSRDNGQPTNLEAVLKTHGIDKKKFSEFANIETAADAKRLFNDKGALSSVISDFQAKG